MKNVYQENGYESRKGYLTDLADQYGVDVDQVFLLADILGESEDFDGLVSMVQDLEY